MLTFVCNVLGILLILVLLFNFCDDLDRPNDNIGIHEHDSYDDYDNEDF